MPISEYKREKINKKKLFEILRESVHLLIHFSANVRKYGEYSLRSSLYTFLRNIFSEYKRGKINEKKLLRILKESVIRL